MAEKNMCDDDLTTDSVPEPPREFSNSEPSVENGVDEGNPKEEKSGAKKKETSQKASKPSKSKKSHKKPDYTPPPASSPVINIQGNNVHIGHVFNLNATSQNQKTSFVKKEKTVVMPRKVSKIIESSDIVTRDDLDAAAEHIGNGWMDVGKKLGFSEGQLQQMEENFKKEKINFKEMVYQMLLDWKYFKDHKATVGILCKSLWDSQQYDAANHLAEERLKK